MGFRRRRPFYEPRAIEKMRLDRLKESSKALANTFYYGGESYLQLKFFIQHILGT